MEVTTQAQTNKTFHSVRLQYPQPTIAVVAMEEKEHRNTFAPNLINGLTQAFEHIAQTDARVVVIHGFDNYFCCGGTKEELLTLFRGEATFTELDFHDVLLRCEVPTIAAMQGHAIGGGLAFACHADLMILAEEAIYSANFMKYGFTPGMGSTYLLPKKFGEVIGQEMLYSANTYYGGVLRDKGIPIPVVKKQEVIPTAMKRAQELADKPLASLKLLKKHLTQEIRERLPSIIEQELAMHQLTFAQPAVKERVEQLFGQ